MSQDNSGENLDSGNPLNLHNFSYCTFWNIFVSNLNVPCSISLMNSFISNTVIKFKYLDQFQNLHLYLPRYK